MGRPQVSVVVPVFNGARYLSEALASVLGQTYGSWEMTVVDDGSADASGDIARTFTSDPRVRVLSQTNSGVSVARNNGLQASHAEYIAFLDADDVWLPSNLLRKVDWLESHPDSALVHSDAAIIDATSHRTGQVLRGSEGRVLDRQLLWDGDAIPCLPSNAVVRRAVLDKVGAFDPDLSTAADQEIKFRITAAYSIGRIPEVLVLYRIHGANMHMNIRMMEQDHLKAYAKATANGLFTTEAFRAHCYANLFLILAGSWWHGGNRIRAVSFALKAVALRPAHAALLARKATAVLRRGRLGR